MSAGPWAGLRVVELTGLTSAYATRMWAGLGADVVVAEPTDGHLLRHLPPFAPGPAGSETSLWWAFFGQGKQSVVAPPGLCNDPHLRGAGFWREEQHPVLGPVPTAGAPFRVDHDWWHWATAPALGAGLR